MPRRTSATVQDLYADMQHRVGDPRTGLITSAHLNGQTDLAQSLEASLRRDMAGSPVSIMRNPQTYQQKVARMWEAYATDPLFQRLINRSVDFIANGSSWQVQDDTSPENNWLTRITNWFKPGSPTIGSMHQQDIWNAWAEQINSGVPNTPQGLNEIVSWAARHCLLSGSWVPHWQWGTFRYGRQTLLMPTQLTCYPSSIVTLVRQQQQFMNERIFLMMPQQQGAGMPMTGQPMEAPATTAGGPQPGMIPLENIGERPDVRLGQTEAFYLKYQWSPGDLSTTRLGTTYQTSWAQYPNPPFVSLLPQFTLRQKLFAGDLALADSVANYQRIFSIGDKDHPPIAPTRDKNGVVTKSGTVSMIRDMIEAAVANPAYALYLPFWVQYEEKIPDIKMLLAEEKYVYSDVLIMMAFGIIASRSVASRNERFEVLNIAAFEEMLESIRRLIGSLLQRLAFRIVEVNGTVLKAPARWRPKPLNTKNSDYRKALLDIAKMGKISSKTLAEHYGLDASVELRQIADDLARQADDVYDDNVPVTFNQTTTDSGSGGDGGDTGKTPNPKSPAGGPSRKNRKRSSVSQPPAGSTP